uniref:Extracellular sulfatase SULF-1 homolog n=1 Tax=Cacopsylla melanoneura TaxID=428564 RepID=A0A8D8W5N5_9HEMI
MIFYTRFLFTTFTFLLFMHSTLTRKSSLNVESSDHRRLKAKSRQQFSGQQSYPGYMNEERKPNIILFLTDDQDVELGSLNFMKKTLRLVRDGGAEFRHAYTTTPMCCPSRSSLLTGLYMHNHNVYTNNDNCSSPQWQAEHEPRSFATYLSNSGYRTGYFGKYLNKYNGSHVPPGWREWGGLIFNSKYYNYSINMNGRKIKHGDNYLNDYYTDLIANDSVQFLRQSKQSFSKKPIMLVMSFPAPHGPEDSAPQYSNMYFNVTSHHTPSYDYAPNPDKQWILRYTGKMKPVFKEFTDLLMTKRLQTLQSVDDAVEKVMKELKDLGELNNTYIIYTSDHGYHMGQFGLIKGKAFPFEFDIRVPFMMRGPGIVPGTIIDDLVLNIDIAPTILDLAGIAAPPHMDGRSMLKLLLRRKGHKKHETKWPDTFLVESSGRRDIPILQKSQPTTPPVQAENNTSQHLFATDGNLLSPNNDIQSERSLYQHLSKAERMLLHCQSPEYQSPCKSGQKWYCTFDGTRWRKHKCKVKSIKIRPNNLCACFNSDGVIYTYNPDHVTSPRVVRDFTSVITNRPKIIRYLPDYKTLEDILQVAWKHPRRQQKRQSPTLIRTHLSSVEDTVMKQISVLQIFHDGINAKCSISQNSEVSCSNEMYSNPRLWRASKNKVQKQIRKLLIKLSQLKAIEKHLEDRQPLEDPTIPMDKQLRPLDKNRNTKHRHRHENQTKSYDLETNGLFENMYTNVTKVDHGRYDNRFHNLLSDTCYCAHAGNTLSAKEQAAIEKQQQREERMKRKERKLKKKLKIEKECFTEKMNCFSHDNDHWKTAPFWTLGPFCFCVNANNNTYSCLRTINATHNFLYCEFVTGFITFYNMRIDPFQQWNRAFSLSDHEKTWLHSSLNTLRSCRGSRECHLGYNATSIDSINPSGNETCVNCHLRKNKQVQRTVLRTFTS